MISIKYTWDSNHDNLCRNCPFNKKGMEMQEITKLQAEAIKRVKHNKNYAIIAHMHQAWSGANSVLLYLDLRTFIICLFGNYYHK